MNTEPKPLASLSSGLLARKGAARPAMRPQGFGQVGASLEDLGWNDMGFEPPKPAATAEADADHDAFGEVIPAHPHNLGGLTPVDSPVHDQQAQLAGRLSAYTPDDSDEDEDVDDTAEIYDPESEVEADDEIEAEAETESKASLEDAAEEAVVPVVASSTDKLVAKLPPAQDSQPQPRPSRAAPASRRLHAPRAAPGSKAKAAFTLRLDPERHLKLRLACAVDGRSAQMLVTQALDELLASMPELEAMAGKAKRKG